MLNLKTLNDIFFTIVYGQLDRAMLFKDASGTWAPISSAQVYQRTRSLAAAFLQYGIAAGDRIAILSENRWEWAIADFAALAIGAIDVPIYPTLTAEQTAVLLADSAARIAVVSSRAQCEKIASIRARTMLEQVVIMDEAGAPDAVPFGSLLAGAEQFSGRDAGFDRRAAEVAPSDIATIIYTSGTTGEPKGVVLTHANLAANVNESLIGFEVHPGDTCISFLPLSHITARHLDYAIYAKRATVAYCPAFDQLPAAMAAIKPTVFVAVPRVYEKVRQEVERQAALSPLKRKVLRWAAAVGARHRDAIARGKKPASLAWKLAGALVYNKVRKAFGGEVRYFISGGAPLGMDTAEWFSNVGIRILEGYGLSETSPVLAINNATGYRMGSVGKPLPQVSCRFAPDGELLVKGPNVFSGYWKHPRHAPEIFDAGGWFHTGDIGYLDADGFLYITDRKKELLKTSGGKLIAPQPIENKLKSHLLVAEAALVGDRHKFAAALIAPNFTALENWAAQRQVAATSRRELLAHPTVLAQYQAIVDQVNFGLAGFESIKRFLLVPDEWSLTTGELTPSLKLKRRVVQEKYAAEIASFYADEATAHR